MLPTNSKSYALGSLPRTRQRPPARARLKGAAANVGGESLRQAAYAIEKSADARDLSAAAASGLPALETRLLELKLVIEEEWNADQNPGTN